MIHYDKIFIAKIWFQKQSICYHSLLSTKIRFNFKTQLSMMELKYYFISGKTIFLRKLRSQMLIAQNSWLICMNHYLHCFQASIFIQHVWHWTSFAFDLIVGCMFNYKKNFKLRKIVMNVNFNFKSELNEISENLLRKSEKVWNFL